jgi:ubiquinone/menaquinone biosynthesis C-methylase UbiE
MAYAHVSGGSSDVTALYGERTVATSSQYLLPHLTPTTTIIDIGCGPGVITSDLAKICTQGKVIGIDNSPEIIAQASASFPSSEIKNLTFEIGDANDLKNFQDGSFDIVHGHALLVHMKDPVAVLKEMKRVCKIGGIVACRESTPKNTISLKPDVPAIREYWTRAMFAMTQMGGHSDAGEKLEEWAKEAGLGEKIVGSKSLQQQPSHLVRCQGEPAEQAVKWGMATMEEIEGWRKGWEEWEKAEEHEWLFECGEILCWKTG